MNAKTISSLLLVFLLELGNSLATTFLQFDSTYLGDGWFQYQMQVMDDPFFIEADIEGFSVNFPNEIDHSTNLQNWTNSSSANNHSSWSFSQSIPPRPYSEVFLVRSSETSFRMGQYGGDGAMVLFSLFPTEFNPLALSGIISGNIVGYAFFPCLVPCNPDQADGSPTNASYALKLVPDVNIKQLIQSNGVVSGVDVVWDFDCTFVLQASRNLAAWTNIAYIWSTPPETLWITNMPLNNFGQFFRVALAAVEHTTNLPPINANVLPAKRAVSPASLTAAIPRVAGCQITQGKVAVNVVTAPNQNYTVSAVNSHKAVLATQSLNATGDSGTVYFDATSLPTPVFFQVASVP